jgi:hypothetical protein
VPLYDVEYADLGLSSSEKHLDDVSSDETAASNDQTMATETRQLVVGQA